MSAKGELNQVEANFSSKSFFGMPLTAHEVLVERCDKYLSDLYWKDVNLFSVRYHETTPIEDIAVYEVPGMERPSFRAVIHKKKKASYHPATHLSIEKSASAYSGEHEQQNSQGSPAVIHLPPPVPAEPDDAPIFHPLSMRKKGDQTLVQHGAPSGSVCVLSFLSRAFDNIATAWLCDGIVRVRQCYIQARASLSVATRGVTGAIVEISFTSEISSQKSKMTLP